MSIGAISEKYSVFESKHLVYESLIPKHTLRDVQGVPETALYRPGHQELLPKNNAKEQCQRKQDLVRRNAKDQEMNTKRVCVLTMY